MSSPAHKTRKSFKHEISGDRPKHSAINLLKGRGLGGKKAERFIGKPGDELLDEDEYEYEEQDFEVPQEKSIKFTTSVSNLASFKKLTKEALNSYLSSGSFEEFTRKLDESEVKETYFLDLPAILIKQSFEMNADERRQVEVLLSQLYKSDYLTPAHFAASVRKLYNSLSDLLIDFPQAQIILKEFTGFLIAGTFIEKKVVDECEDQTVALSDTKAVSQLKEKISDIVKEYFSSEDFGELKQSIEELKAPHLHFEVVKKLVSISLDRQDRQRELASLAICHLTGNLLKREDVELAFSTFLYRLEDLVLDVPNVLKMLSCFIARAVVDEAIPPAFLDRVDLSGQDLGNQVLQQAQVLLNQSRGTSKLQYVWGIRPEYDEEEENEQ